MPEDYGIKVSKTGNDVKTATEDNIIMTSGRNCLKVNDVQSDTLTTNNPSPPTPCNGSKTVVHGLGFIPVVIVVFDYVNEYYFVPFDFYYTIFPPSIFYSTLTITDSSFTVYFRSNEAGAYNSTFPFYYFLSETESAV
jgi:hypothetical protein